MPSMEGIVDLTHVPNMGVALLSCTTVNEPIKAKPICYSSQRRIIPQPALDPRFAAMSGSVDCSSAIAVLHDYFDPTGME